MKRLLVSAGTLIFIGAVAISATGAFFSDTETSTGNTFAAGELDLTIDNTSYGFDWNDPLATNPTGVWGLNAANSWQLADLTNQLFFSFDDLKPGDYGEDTISLHVQNNAWACMALDLTGTPENGVNEPEADFPDLTVGADEGELQNYLSFLFWNDDGDNVLETGETVIPELSGLPGSAFTGNWLAIADQGDTPLQAGTTTWIGKGWCFGTMTPNPVVQDNASSSPPVAPDRIGFTCNGAGDHNIAQTDGIVVDVHFYAEQSRNNPNFLCSQLPPPDGRQVVGAAAATYDDPAICNVTVDLGESLQAAIDVAAPGDTICVDPTYTGVGDVASVIEVNELNLTIAGLGAAGAATVSKGLHIDANGVTIKGLTLNAHPLIEASEQAAIYINSAITGTTITHNLIDGPPGAIAANAKGIITEIGNDGTAGASGILVAHNLIRGWNQGIFFNTANAEVRFNDIYANTVGVANDGPHNTTIHHNDFDGNTAEAVGVAPSANNGTANNGDLDVNTNNFTPAGAGNNVNHYLASVVGGADVNATNNFWDSEVEADRTNVPAEVDTSSPAAVAFPEN
ncbi:hypothetical protein A3F55_01615 [Candidatus Adlerbacteria bacterium RIFCSPHIGHO2_12_FULL_53_18]|uniref:Right handed beta helix domain-containing protein n=2 Tax=Parcubacteria group TaxID=1794811 RepID=A0A1F4XRX1_9BACT|nr:MAG: hypothetical protein A3F55_01615 [Candidatus Adlerbacteria bacterium RIFCSPHIGHO2_12_FULL_53_18]OGG51481.1 MAG: hypothetical protein A2704_04155 [Candidatus Kaiserbacteria bacterium RIFCSPHIGHO2_01_FULL_54_36b]